VAALIAAQRDEHGIPAALACRALGVSRSWFYKHDDGGLPPRAARREQLRAEVRRLFAAHRGTYGSPRITADLREAGWTVSENTVAAVMAELGLAARRKKKRKATTRPGKGRWRAPNLVKRDFPAREVNLKWYGDGTEIPTGEGKLHLASVLDVASRRVLGFALSEHHDAALAYGALAMAVAVRGYRCRRVRRAPRRGAPRAERGPGPGWNEQLLAAPRRGPDSRTGTAGRDPRGRRAIRRPLSRPAPRGHAAGHPEIRRRPHPRQLRS
jgi:transposase InsO family protein